jgi:hypothetical protein
MKKLLSKTMVGAFAVLALFAYQAPTARAAGVVRIVSTATLNVPESYTAFDFGTCDQNNFPLPKTGDPACVAFVNEVYDAKGDFTGQLSFEVAFTEFSDYSDSFADYQLWDGSLTDGRTGTFIVLEQGAAKSDGSYSSKLTVVEGTGTGDFAGVSGKGSSLGTLDSGTNTLKLKFPNH